MDGVSGLSKQNTYDDGDIERMKGLENLSTNAAINRIGNHAGLDTTHAIHGSDKTANEVVAEHREAVRQEWSPKQVVREEFGHAAGHAAEHLAIYAHEHGQYDAVMKALDERDVRYTQHDVAFRG